MDMMDENFVFFEPSVKYLENKLNKLHMASRFMKLQNTQIINNMMIDLLRHDILNYYEVVARLKASHLSVDDDEEIYELNLKIILAKIENADYELMISLDNNCEPGIYERLEGPIIRSYRWHSRRFWMMFLHNISMNVNSQNYMTENIGKIVNNLDLRRFIGEYL